MAYSQTGDRAKIKTGEAKSRMVSSLFIYPVRPAMRDERGDDAYSESGYLSEMPGFTSPLFLTG